MKASTPVSPQYISALQGALCWQASLFVLTALTLDFFYMNHVMVAAAAAHWLGIILLLVRRPDSPTRGDLRFCRHGYPAVFVASVLIAPFVMETLGHQTLLKTWFGFDLQRDGECSFPVFVLATAWLLVYPFRHRFGKKLTPTSVVQVGIKNEP